MTRKKKKKIVVSVSCLGHGVYDHIGGDLTPEELTAIGQVFMEAAEFRRQNAYGRIGCYEYTPKGKQKYIMAEVAIDHTDIEFDMDAGLPLLKEIKVSA